MSKRFLLPCGCGAKMAIEMSQAGQQLVCTRCGATVEVPTMRGIRQLEPAAEQAAAARTARGWSGGQGALFAGGLLLVVCSLALGGFALARRAQLDTGRPIIRDYDQFNKVIDQLPPEEVWRIWYEEIERDSLGLWEPAPYLQRRQQARVWTVVLITTLATTGLGIAGVAAALMIRT